MSRELIQELRDALSGMLDVFGVGSHGEDWPGDQSGFVACEAARNGIAKADGALSQPIDHANYCASYEDVSTEFAASKFESPALRLDAMIDTIVELRAARQAGTEKE